MPPAPNFARNWKRLVSGKSSIEKWASETESADVDLQLLEPPMDLNAILPQFARHRGDVSTVSGQECHEFLSPLQLALVQAERYYSLHGRCRPQRPPRALPEVRRRNPL